MSGAPVPWDDREAREHVARAETLLSEVDTLTDPAAREHVTRTLHALVELYGQCLARVVRHAGPATRAELAADELVGHLLLVHDLHPDPVEVRVRRALDDLPGARLLAVEEPAVRVGVTASGCGSSAEGLRTAVRDAVARVAPEIERVEVEEVRTPTVIPVDALFRTGAAPAGR